MNEAARPHALPVRTRARLRLRHGWRLAGEVTRYSAQHRIWWLVPVVVLLAIAALAITTTSATLPVAVYTLF